MSKASFIIVLFSSGAVLCLPLLGFLSVRLFLAKWANPGVRVIVNWVNLED